MNSKENIIEGPFGVVAFCLLVVVTVWLYLMATPPQMSGEYDRAAEASAQVDDVEEVR